VLTGGAAVLGSGLVGGLGLSGCGSRAQRLRLAAGDPSGIYAAFARLLKTRLESGVDGLTVQVQASAGSVDNLRRLAEGDADIGLALADSLADGRGAGIVALAQTYENYLQLLVLAGSPVQDVQGLRGRSVVLGAAGSGAALSGAQLLLAAGLDGEAVQVGHAPLAVSLEQLAGGTVDAVLWSGGLPTPAIAELDRERSLRMLDLGDLAAAMQRTYGYDYRSRRVPRVAYAAGAVRTVGVPNLLLARPGLRDDLAGTVVETMARDAAELVPGFALGVQYLTPATMIRTGDVPLHPGAIAAYRRVHG